MAYDILHETAEEMSQLGLTGQIKEVSAEDLYQIGHNPIEMSDFYAQRVEFYIGEHLNLKMVQIDRPLSSGRTASLQDMRTLLSDPLEKAAYNRAMEIINEFGMSQRGSMMLDKMVMHQFPDGSSAMLPEPISQAMTDAFDRVVPVALELGKVQPKNLSWIMRGRSWARQLKQEVEHNIYRRTDLVETLTKETGEDTFLAKYASLSLKSQLAFRWGAVGVGTAAAAGATAALGAGILPGLAAGALLSHTGAMKWIDPTIRKAMEIDEVKAKSLEAKAKELEEKYYKEWYTEAVEEEAKAKGKDLAEYLKDRVSDQPSELSLKGRTIADVIAEIALKYPRFNALIKTGVTVGLYLPTQAYYLSNALGGIVQVYMRHGLIDSTKLLGASAAEVRFNMSVISMVHGEGYRNNSPKSIIITKDMRIYTSDMVADMVTTYGVGSSFIKAETSRSLSEDFYRRNRTASSKFVHELGGETLNLMMVEMAETMDNVYRISMFTKHLKDGYAPDHAAKLVRETMFDYADLTDFERDVMRQIFLFYSFMRKNTAMVWWTLLNEPSRLMAQFRLTGDLAESAVDDDPEIVIGEFYNTRMIVPGSFREFKNKKGQRLFGNMYQGRVYVSPAMNGADGIAMFGSFLGLLSMKNPDAWQTFLSSTTPIVQTGGVLATGVLPFKGMDVTRIKVDPDLVELDRVLGTHVFSNGPHHWGAIDLRFQQELDPMKIKDEYTVVYYPRR
jgi:hypothetical protein